MTLQDQITACYRSTPDRIGRDILQILERVVERITLLEEGDEPEHAADLWLPMSSAPKDGTKILIWSPESDDKYWVAGWNGKWWDNGDYAVAFPECWQPLPAPPKGC